MIRSFGPSFGKASVDFHPTGSPIKEEQTKNFLSELEQHPEFKNLVESAPDGTTEILAGNRGLFAHYKINIRHPNASAGRFVLFSWFDFSSGRQAGVIHEVIAALKGHLESLKR